MRLSRLAPEEIAGAVMLCLVLLLVALRPSAVGDLFASPYATPDPSGGPARSIVQEPAAPTATVDMWPRPTPATPEEAAGWIRFVDGPRVQVVVPEGRECQSPFVFRTTPDTAPAVPIAVLCVHDLPRTDPATVR